MATDYAEMERAFVAQLKDDTGLDLDGWMNAIEASNLTERNAIIDWLRLQGFTFAKASWLERIYHNGGQLVYADNQAMPPNPEPPSLIEDNEHDQGGQHKAPRFERKLRLVHDADLTEKSEEAELSSETKEALPADTQSTEKLQDLTASAKGLRPLCNRILEIVKTLSDQIELAPQAPFIQVRIGGELVMAILPNAKKIRLYGAFTNSASARIQSAESVNRLPAPFPRMIAIDDVRHLDDEFRDLLASAVRH